MIIRGRINTGYVAAPVLSARELEVLTLVARGLTNAGIAGELFISPNTVRKHLRNILQKLDAHTRAHAVAIALTAGQIQIGERTIAHDPDDIVGVGGPNREPGRAARAAVPRRSPRGGRTSGDPVDVVPDRHRIGAALATESLSRARID
jgi:DNA-binding CsgD family transcriptional regulator